MPEINPLVQGSLYSLNNSRRSSQNSPRIISEAPAQVASQNENNNRNRVVRISESALSIDFIENDNARLNVNESQRATVNLSPISQYQNNQQLLKRQELDQIVGIDLFV